MPRPYSPSTFLRFSRIPRNPQKYPGITCNLDQIPRFVDIPFIDDTGVELAPPGPIVDMGAYEAQPPVYLPLVIKSY
jgi:hypothetical protein